MKKLILATAAVALTTVGTAGAADLPMKAPPMAPPAMTWTGCYISGGIGYGLWSQDHYTESHATTAGPLTADTLTTSDSGRGWLGRAGVGCDYQFSSNFLIGAFADYDWMSLKGTNTQDTSALPVGVSPFFGLAGQEKETGAWHAGIRLGYLPYPNLLAFLSGGYTQAQFGQVNFLANDADTFALGGATGVFLPATTYSGWFIGGGTEYRLPWWQNLTWKTEYRFASYSAKDILDQCIGGGAACGVAGVELFGENSQKYVQTVTTSLVWRFNFGGPVVAKY